MTTASGYARQRPRTTCGLSHPSEAWRYSAPRLRLMAHLSTSFVRRVEGHGRSGACRFLAALPDCSSPTWRAPSRGRQTANASRSCALESVPRFRRNCSWQTPMADGNANWPANETPPRGSRWSLPGDQASLRPGHPTAGSLRSLPRVLPVDGSCTSTAAPGRYRTAKSLARPPGRWTDSAGSTPGRFYSTMQPNSVLRGS